MAFWGVLLQLLLQLLPLPPLYGILGLLALLFGVFVVAVLALKLWDRHPLSAGAGIALVLFPFVLVTFSQVGWSLTKADSTVAFCGVGA